MKKLIHLLPWLLIATNAFAAKMPAKHLYLTVQNMPQCQWMRTDASQIIVTENGDTFINKTAPVYHGTDTKDNGPGLHHPIFVYKSPGNKIYLRLPKNVIWDTTYEKEPPNYLPVDSIEDD